MILPLKTQAQLQAEEAHAFCLRVQREYTVRTGQFKPTTIEERRWAAEGIRALMQFDSLADEIARSLCHA